MNMVGHHGNTWDHDRWWTAPPQYGLTTRLGVIDGSIDPAVTSTGKFSSKQGIVKLLVNAPMRSQICCRESSSQPQLNRAGFFGDWIR